MLFIRCKVTCDTCQNREEDFDAPMGGATPKLPKGWVVDRPGRYDDDEIYIRSEPEQLKNSCPACVKNRA